MNITKQEMGTPTESTMATTTTIDISNMHFLNGNNSSTGEGESTNGGQSFTETGGGDDSSVTSSHVDGSHFGSDRSQTDMSTGSTRSKTAEMLIGFKETILVKRSKICVLLVMALAAAGAAVALYTLSVENEKEDFQQQMDDFATEIIKVSQRNAHEIFNALTALSVSTTSYALDQSMIWPYVSLPHFAQRGTPIVELSSAKFVGFSPLVEEKDQLLWESWSIGQPQPSESTITPYLYRYDNRISSSVPPPPVDGTTGSSGYYAPLWQISPTMTMTNSRSMINMDLLTYAPTGYYLLDNIIPELMSTSTSAAQQQLALSMLELNASPDPNDTTTWPYTYMATPVWDNFQENDGEIVALYNALVPWHTFLVDILPVDHHSDDTDSISSSSHHEMIVVVQNTCQQAITFQLNGPHVTYLGNMDQHDTSFDEYEVSAPFEVGGLLAHSRQDGTTSRCDYTLHVYPTRAFYESFETSQPWYYTGAVLGLFVLMALVFIIYDCNVQKRQKLVLSSAERSNAIVSSLFPSQVRDRLMNTEDEDEIGKVAQSKSGKKKSSRRTSDFMMGGGIMGSGDEGKQSSSFMIPTNELAAAQAGGGGGDTALQNPSSMIYSKPIADLFPCASVMFADICGFTAWSSQREPTQVFMLLEHIYSTFDKIAKRRRIFKVETIGDCYVATAGLPIPRDDHPVLMSKFANECRSKMVKVVKQLDVILGPGTADLRMRIGLHAGPVTAGVLRGEKSRFQLFGDTVNTASRIESAGERNMIHLSADFADLLVKAGNEEWIEPREGMIAAKGKGMMQTYWLNMKKKPSSKDLAADAEATSAREVAAKMLESDAESSDGGGSSLDDDDDSDAEEGGGRRRSKLFNGMDHKAQRLIHWNVEVLQQSLRKIVALRNEPPSPQKIAGLSQVHHPSGSMVRDEVVEMIPLTTKRPTSELQVPELNQEIRAQLEDYVIAITAMYNEISFHNFEHASHVLMSVTKMFTKVDAKEEGPHNYTCLLSSDPLVQFACTMAALIHDCDHTGLTNEQLIARKDDVAHIYRNKSPAEQNSIDLAWGLLMEESYAELRSCIYSSQEELNRFRNLVVNSVIATDLFDKDLAANRQRLWDEAFPSDHSSSELQEQDHKSRKATAVVELMVQASDISHTMQHWSVYRKWNEKLFHEQYKAFMAGNGGKDDPSVTWYQDEMDFFDSFVIPVAKKLEECGVFGTAGSEYLGYCQDNRHEWEAKGKESVKGYVWSYHKREEMMRAKAEMIAAKAARRER